MKNKDIILVLTLMMLFVVLVFLTPFMDNNASSLLWIAFFMIMASIIILWTIISLTKFSKEDLIKKFKKQPKIVQILDIAIIILIAYETITLNPVHITWLLIFLIIVIPFVQWLFKKEE